METRNVNKGYLQNNALISLSSQPLPSARTFHVCYTLLYLPVKRFYSDICCHSWSVCSIFLLWPEVNIWYEGKTFFKLPTSTFACSLKKIVNIKCYIRAIMILWYSVDKCFWTLIIISWISQVLLVSPKNSNFSCKIIFMLSGCTFRAYMPSCVSSRSLDYHLPVCHLGHLIAIIQQQELVVAPSRSIETIQFFHHKLILGPILLAYFYFLSLINKDIFK